MRSKPILFIEAADTFIQRIFIFIGGIFYPPGEPILQHLLRYVGSRGGKPQLRPPSLASAATSTRE
jgi:hypothetical protein